MYRTAQTLVRGKEPYEQAISDCPTRNLTINDHENNKVNIVWYPKRWHDISTDRPPPFPYQVYLTNTAASVAESPDFPAAFAGFIEQIGGNQEQNWNFHFEVYSKSFPNILGCIAHQRKEVSHRNRNGIVPRLVPTWASNTDDDGPSYKGRIIVVDRDDWADAGITLVSFDPAEYDRPSHFDHWDVPGSGDYDIVRASRYQANSSILECLRDWWMVAGHSWTEADLARRNDGGVSPALYPAVDPDSHYDVEHDEVHELDVTALPGPATVANGNANDDLDNRDLKILDTFDRDELFTSDEQLRNLFTANYSDSFGLPVTSIWSSQNSKLRPPFSITVYLAFDLLPIPPRALFGCLNKGLISQGAWTLDVVNNLPSLDSAFQYHTRAALCRTPEEVSRTRLCMRIILQRVASSKLPNELVEYIEDLLVPPEIPNYSHRPCRTFKDVFMYLDMKHLTTGPLLVYANREDFPGRELARAESSTEPDARLYADWKESVFETDLLRVVYLRFWRRISDELHNLWSMCSPRSCAIGNVPLPRIFLKLTMAEIVVWRATGEQYVNGRPDVEIMLQSDKPITVHRHSLVPHDMFSHYIWEEAIDVVDLDSSHVHPSPSCDRPRDAHFHDSWEQPPDLGFPGLNSLLAGETRLTSFLPGHSGKLVLGPHRTWWQDRIRRGMLKNGRQYALRLKPGITVPRWTFGSIGALQGPYDLPPIPVIMEEEPRFTFRVESVGAPYGSFSRG